MPKKIIYAEDAIDVVTSSVMEWDGMYIQDLNGRIREAIEQLPSAQPETCAYWDRESNYCALHRPSAQPERKPGKTLAEEVERIKRELTDIFTEQMSVQPQRIKGRWIEDGYDHYKAVCSECGEPCGTYVMGKPRDRFCKWCGADMKVGVIKI